MKRHFGWIGTVLCLVPMLAMRAAAASPSAAGHTGFALDSSSCGVIGGVLVVASLFASRRSARDDS